MEKKIEIILSMNEVLNILERQYNIQYDKVMETYPFINGIAEKFQASYQSDGTFKVTMVAIKVKHIIGS
jgi:hypothetical protein